MADERISPITFPLYYDRWIAATRHMSASARGVYIDWLGWSWVRGKPLPLNVETRAQIAAVTPAILRKLWPELQEFWKRTPAGYVNVSLERKRTEHHDFYTSQKIKAHKGAAVRWGKHARGNARGNAPVDAPRMPSDLGSRSSDLDLEDQTQDQEQSRSDNSRKLNGHKVKDSNPKALHLMARVVLKEFPNEPASEHSALLKERAARAGIEYDSGLIVKALESAEHQGKVRK